MDISESPITHKKKWSINELLTLSVQKEDKLNQERMESVIY